MLRTQKRASGIVNNSTRIIFTKKTILFELLEAFLKNYSIQKIRNYDLFIADANNANLGILNNTARITF